MDWLMNTARNPDAGCWGGHYLKSGKLKKTNDISITFHIVSHLNGEVPDWPKIIDTTLAIKGVRYGWMNSTHVSCANRIGQERIELYRRQMHLAAPPAAPFARQPRKTSNTPAA